MDAKLTIVDVTGSTNDDLLEAGKQGAPHGTGLAARAQTAGRGRRGHKWDSTAGNLLLSIVLRPCVNPAKYSGLAAVSGLAVLEALEKQGLANEIGLKWPNDLVARGRKLGGILVEAARDNEGKPFAVCGIGVNVNYVPSEVPDGGLAAIGLSDLNKNVPTVDTLLDAVYHAVVEGVDTWEKCLNTMESSVGPLAPILDDYVARLNWIGNHVIARSPARRRAGARNIQNGRRLWSREHRDGGRAPRIPLRRSILAPFERIGCQSHPLSSIIRLLKPKLKTKGPRYRNGSGAL